MPLIPSGQTIVQKILILMPPVFARSAHGFSGTGQEMGSRLTKLLCALGVIMLLSGCTPSIDISVPPSSTSIQLESLAFEANEMIPSQYTCDGADQSPALTWSSPPPEAESLVLIMDDPDAPRGTFVHWIVYNLPRDTVSLEAGIGNQDNQDRFQVLGEHHGKNDFGVVGYRGPCPPRQTHRYVFKLYTLDIKLELPAGASKSDIAKAIDGHIVAFGELVGLYTRT